MLKFTIFDDVHQPVTLGTPPGYVGPGLEVKIEKHDGTVKQMMNHVSSAVCAQWLIDTEA